MIRRAVCILLLFVFVAACGASAREKTLRATYTGVAAAQVAFTAWDKEHQLAIARSAPSEQAGIAELGSYAEARAPVMRGFEAVYHAIAAAILVDDDPKGLTTALRAAEELRLALSALTKGALP